MTTLARRLLTEALDDAQGEILANLESKAQTGGADWLEIHFASLPRRIGRELMQGGLTREGDVAIIQESYRRCDLAAPLILEAGGVATDAKVLEKLYFQGDHEERRMIQKALAFLPIGEGTIRLLQEAHRTNEEPIFLAAFADHNLPARALDDGDFARGILKSAFIDLDVDRLVDATSRAKASLSTMLLDFMSEREAAHRSVWPGSLVLAAHAPCPGTRAKITGDLWSGVDARRVAAARAAATLGDTSLLPEIEARLSVERYAPAQATLTTARTALS